MIVKTSRSFVCSSTSRPPPRRPRCRLPLPPAPGSGSACPRHPADQAQAENTPPGRIYVSSISDFPANATIQYLIDIIYIHDKSPNSGWMSWIPPSRATCRHWVDLAQRLMMMNPKPFGTRNLQSPTSRSLSSRTRRSCRSPPRQDTVLAESKLGQRWRTALS